MHICYHTILLPMILLCVAQSSVSVHSQPLYTIQRATKLCGACVTYVFEFMFHLIIESLGLSKVALVINVYHVFLAKHFILKSICLIIADKIPSVGLENGTTYQGWQRSVSLFILLHPSLLLGQWPFIVLSFFAIFLYCEKQHPGLAARDDCYESLIHRRKDRHLIFFIWFCPLRNLGALSLVNITRDIFRHGTASRMHFLEYGQ